MQRDHGNAIEIDRTAETRRGDVPVYISDCTRLHAITAWRPRRGPREILADIHQWIVAYEADLQGVL